MSGIAARDVHSNPLGTLERLLYTHQGILDPHVRPRGLKHIVAEEVIELALSRERDKRFTGPLEKYARYTEAFWKTVGDIEADGIMFLDPLAPVLESPLGVQRLGIDDFCTQTDFAPKLMWLHEQYDEQTRAGLERWVFWRMGIYDLPWTVQEEQVRHAIPTLVPKVNRQVEWGRGKGLRHWTRDKGATSQDETVKLGSVAISLNSFEQLLRIPAYIKRETERHSGRYGSTSEERFIERQRAAIRINRELLKQKYSLALEKLGIDKPYAYMLEGDLGMDLLPRTREQIRVPGQKLLSGISSKGPVDPQALNRLSGFFTALYGGKPVVFPRQATQENQLTTSTRWPWLRTLQKSAELEHAIGAIPTQELEEMVEDLTRFAAGLETIEAVTFRLAYGNERVYTEDESTQWRDATNSQQVQPWDIRRFRTTELHRDIRPSNTGATRCVMQAWLNMRPEAREFRPGMSARVGSLSHDIRNHLNSKEYEALRNLGIAGMPRENYCEIPITQEIIPTKEEWERAEDYIHKNHGNNDQLWNPMLTALRQAMKTGSFWDGGKPDAVLTLDDDTPVLVDYKRRRAQYYPTPYFFFQMGRYARILIDLSGRKPERFFTVVAQRPYAPAVEENEVLPERGVYRGQKLHIKRFERDSESWHQVRTIQIYEITRKAMFEKRPDLQQYVHSEQERRGVCEECFHNTTEQPLCRTVLEGVRKPWPTPGLASA